MKKSVYAILILSLSFIGAKSFASKIELSQISKTLIHDEGGIGPGGNGSVKNGVVRTK